MREILACGHENNLSLQERTSGFCPKCKTEQEIVETIADEERN